MWCKAVLVCLLGAALAVPLHQTEGNEILLQETQGVDIWPSLSRLLDQFKDYIIHREKQLDLITILHLMGISDEDIINAIEHLESIANEIADEMTLEEKLKFENAGMDILMMINNGNFNLKAVLGDLYTIKTVLYPHLPENQQQLLDTLEQGIITILKIFGIA